MILVERVLGNRADAPWAERLAGATVDLLALDQWEAQKNRFRKKAASGTELAVSLDRGAFLKDGDVLTYDAATNTAVVARISLREVMIVDLAPLGVLAPDAVMRTCVELGHALGNQHWPALVKGTRVFVPLTVDRKVMASVMKTHRFQDIAYEFAPGSEIIPYLAPHESRRLFGGAEGPVHSHVADMLQRQHHPLQHAAEHAHDHAHPHVHGDGIAHDHPHDHDHAHGHGQDLAHDHDHGGERR